MPPASEALYFDGAPVAHIVAFEERVRLSRIAQTGRAAIACQALRMCAK